MTKNIYVLDTSVILTDPRCLNSFKNSIIIIPIDVIGELDKIKSRNHSDVAKHARSFTRIIDNAYANIGPFEIGTNKVYIDTLTHTYKVSTYGEPSYVDNKILACACEHNGTIISKDLNLRIRAKAYGIGAQDYKEKKKFTHEFYSGTTEIVSSELGSRLIEESEISCPVELEELFPNECVFFKKDNGKGGVLCRKISNGLHLVIDRAPWNLRTKNIEQAFAVDLLLDKNVPLVTLAGRAGTGKSLISVACALESVLGKKAHNKIIIYRPIQPMGADIGYLPGSFQEKLDPWMAPIKDSLEFLFPKKSKDAWKDSLSQFSDRIHTEALTYVRGRSINNAFIILDECQNISKEEIKTVLTRIGYGSKIVLTGDIEQIDNSRLDTENNGLSYIIDKFKESELAGHVTLIKGERSPLATLASEIL